MSYMRSQPRTPIFVVLALQASLCGTSSAAEPDKGRYDFFNPVPNNLLREFGTDRPSITTGPFTIDPGHVQFETDLVNYTKSRPNEDGTVTEKYLFGSTTVRVGITKDVELSALLQPYNALRTRMVNPTATTWNSGPDVLQLRSKINLYGNDTYKEPGAIAFGLVPFINIPTVRNGVGPQNVDGGIIVPFGLKLSDKADFTAMTEFDLKKNGVGDGYHVEYVNTATVAYKLSSDWTAYVEIATRFNNEGPFGGIVLFGGGFQFMLAENLQLDFGANVGVTRAADRINPFVGLSKRF